MARRRCMFHLDKHKGFIYVMQRAPQRLQDDLKAAMDKWAASVQGDYDNATGYGEGFTKITGKSFAIAESLKKGKGVYVAVGHGAFIARFLETGTKEHDIVQEKRKRVIRVSGIKGTKALSKAWKKHESRIPDVIDSVIKNIISGGD